MKMTLLLVTIAIFHPGLALFVVWMVTTAFAFRLIREGRSELEPIRVPGSEERGSRIETSR